MANLKKLLTAIISIFYLLGRPWYLTFFFIGRVLTILLQQITTFFYPKPFLFFLFPFLLVSAGVYFYLTIIHDLPSPNQLTNREPLLTTKIYDRNGRLLYKIYRKQNRTLVKLEQVPEFLVKATIAIEDREFFHHNGVSLKGITRAIRYNLTHPDKEPIGGSTITQQLAKNALLSPQKTWRRKIKEAILSLLIESKFSKNEILQMYFNEIPYGGTAYGVEEAAQKYFGKHVWELNKAEAALLAGLPAAPTRYSPFGAYPTLAKERQKKVLKTMLKVGFINQNEEKQIAQKPLRFAPQKEFIRAPHFVFYVKDLLVEKYGQQLVEQGGLKVTTTLDLDLQEKVEKIVTEELAKIARLHVGNAAVLVVRPDSGEILSMVGSKDYFDFENDGNVNVVLRPRQPGSAIKPINYATAFGLGFTPATIISDSPITYRVPGSPPYSPKNYDGRYHGKVTLRTALASSLNVPAVKVLATYGVERMIQTGKRLGITTWEEKNRFGLSLTLGGGEVTMLDLAQAYSVLANLGKKVPLNPLISVSNHRQVWYQKESTKFSQLLQAEEVLDPGIAFLINDILSDNQARVIGFGPHSLLNIPNKKVAVKTGTSNNLRDNWAIGYTPEFVVAVWVGNNDNSPMSAVASGITGASPIWRKVTELLLKRYPQTGWNPPGDIVSTNICAITGTLPCDHCPKVRKEYFLEKFVPQRRCRLQAKLEQSKTSQRPETSKSD
jgi:1A family penicillin-binding protein